MVNNFQTIICDVFVQNRLLPFDASHYFLCVGREVNKNQLRMLYTYLQQSRFLDVILMYLSIKNVFYF